jgi:hypothetical protein
MADRLQTARGTGVPPRWARAADAIGVGLVALAAVVFVWGGFRIGVAGARLSLTSAPRLLLWASLVALARHTLSPAHPVHRDLPRRFLDWQRRRVRNDVADAPAATVSWRFIAGTTALFTGLTLLMTYPLVWRMSDAVYDPGDPLLNLWALSWVAHQLPLDPRHLFDANIFAPERNTLAYSETLIAPGLLTAPLRWAGVSSLFVYNFVFVAGFVASGVGAALLVADLTGDRAAALVAGVVFAFLPFRFDHFAQLQLQQAQWIPFAFAAFHRVLRRGRWGDGLWLGACVAGQLMSCMYYGLYLSLYFVAVGGFLLLWTVPTWRTRLPVIALGAAFALLLFAPAANAYVTAHQIVGERGVLENMTFSATWPNYLAAPDTNRLYGATAAKWGGLERNLFQGAVAMALAALALWPPWTATRAAYALGLCFAVDLTLGFNGLVYRPLYQHAGVFRALRIPALAVILVGFSLAVLAGFGAARVAASFKDPRRRALAAGALAAAVLVECLSIPMSLTAIPTRPPAVYDALVRDHGGGAPATIVEVPMIFAQDPNYQDPIYMYYSTFHWQKLLNGYSGFFPPSYLELAAYMRTFPDAASLQLLRSRDARYAVVHGERLRPDDYRRTIETIDACRCGLTLLVREPWRGSEIRLYRIER